MGREKGRGGEGRSGGEGNGDEGRGWGCGKGKWDGDWWEQGRGLKPR